MYYIRGNKKSHALYMHTSFEGLLPNLSVNTPTVHAAQHFIFHYAIISISTIITNTHTSVNVFEVNIVNIQLPGSQSES